VHDVPLLHVREAANVEDDEALRSQLLRDRVRRQVADAEAGDHRLLERLGARDLEGDPHRVEMRPEGFLHAEPGVGAALADDEGLAQ
jgi:hypothetical protein